MVCREYDPLGNVTAITEDKLGRPTQTTDALGNFTTLQYDGAGRDFVSHDANGNLAQYAYDDASRVKTVSQPLTNVQYTYDPRGNRLTVQSFDSSQTTTFVTARPPVS